METIRYFDMVQTQFTKNTALVALHDYVRLHSKNRGLGPRN